MSFNPSPLSSKIVPNSDKLSEILSTSEILAASLREMNTCRYHKGRWIGAEMSKHYGVQSGGNMTGLALFWDCCDAEDIGSPGCVLGVHKSYDDEDDGVKFVNSF